MKYGLVILTGLLWCGVAGGQQTTTAPNAAAVGVAQPAGEPLTRRGSLLRSSLSGAPDPSRAKVASVSFFHVPEPEPRTMKKHDLITIIIREQSEFSSEGTTDLKKDANLEARIDEWITLSGGKLQGGGQGDVPPAIKMGGNRDFKGEATVDRTDSFTARIAAEVVDVKPNGTFAVQARKRIKTDEEEQEFILTGICRGADVTPDNTVLSTQIANLEVTKSHIGSVRDTTKRGMVPRLLDFINPF